MKNRSRNQTVITNYNYIDSPSHIPEKYRIKEYSQCQSTCLWVCASVCKSAHYRSGLCKLHLKDSAQDVASMRHHPQQNDIRDITWHISTVLRRVLQNGLCSFSRLRKGLLMLCTLELLNFILIIALYAQSLGWVRGAPTPQGAPITDAIIHLMPTRISMKGMWFESMAPRILRKHLLPL